MIRLVLRIFFIFFIQKFTTYKNLLYICNVLLTSSPNVIGTYILKAFSGRFGFNVLESRKFKLSVKNKATRTPLSDVVNTNPLLVGLCIYIPWGFLCCSVLTDRAMRRPLHRGPSNRIGSTFFYCVCTTPKHKRHCRKVALR